MSLFHRIDDQTGSRPGSLDALLWSYEAGRRGVYFRKERDYLPSEKQGAEEGWSQCFLALGWQAGMVELGGLVLVVVFILAPVWNYYIRKRRTLLKKDGNVRPVFWADVKARTQIL